MTRTEPFSGGVLLVDKDRGWTSHDVVARLRKLTGIRRTGHAGTLDPFATGLLVVALGPATRLLRFAQELDKTYIADLELGATSTTLDIEGEITRRQPSPTWPDLDHVRTVLDKFTGEIDQIPPRHSAIKVQGRRLYELARAGEDVEIPIRQVRIQSIDILDFEPPLLRILVECGSGTYIRSLARDIGEELGTGAYCTALRRLKIGQFDVESAQRVDQLAELSPEEIRLTHMHPPDYLVQGLPVCRLDQTGVDGWFHGSKVVCSEMLADSGTMARVYGPGRSFLGIGEVLESGEIQPRVVFPDHRGGDQE